MNLARLQQHTEGAAPDLRRFAIPAAADRARFVRVLFVCLFVSLLVCSCVRVFEMCSKILNF